MLNKVLKSLLKNIRACLAFERTVSRMFSLLHWCQMAYLSEPSSMPEECGSPLESKCGRGFSLDGQSVPNQEWSFMNFSTLRHPCHSYRSKFSLALFFKIAKRSALHICRAQIRQSQSLYLGPMPPNDVSATKRCPCLAYIMISQ